MWLCLMITDQQEEVRVFHIHISLGNLIYLAFLLDLALAPVIFF